ncbi:hypothetical protein BBF96_03560 [Anoxybacter fermentans]|uniref:Uncharacterized protein n=1 Tax=Anoxybacter fermentans TaxID=1323375 RepID=A0A3Q9HP82_9FIRM|nr:DUF483 domain-containing protein [Anoxybacter fermentans]AZR72540.1 hypothetical protein BBF96_03560 [Anoxybacter fermentans]
MIKMDAKKDFVVGLDVPPTAEIIWNDPDAEEEWGSIVERAKTLHYRLEYEMVKHKKRKCATLHISPRNYDKDIERILSDGLVWLPIQRTKSYTGFSHKHFPVDELDMNSNVYGVLARNLEDAEDFRAHSMQKKVNHKGIGKLLGFPKCCSGFFVEEWSNGFYDPVYQSALKSKNVKEIGERHIKIRPHIATHQMMRYVGFRLTSHFPCSLDCKDSIEIGKVWYDLAKKIDPQGLRALERILTLPGRWEVLHGVAVVVTEPFTIIANSIPTKEKWVVEWDEVDTY